jgi:acetoin utilization protein AcuB
MTREVVTVAPEATVADALEVMRSHDIRHVPVMEGGRVVGVVTDRDLRMTLDSDGGAAPGAAVSEIMSAPPVTADSGTPVETAAGILAGRRLGCLPIVDDGELVGILTGSDLLRAFVELMAGRERHSRLEILAPDRPGELARVVRVIGIDHGINITGVVVPQPHGDRALVILHLEVDDASGVVETLRRLGYEAGAPALEARPG